MMSSQPIHRHFQPQPGLTKVVNATLNHTLCALYAKLLGSLRLSHSASLGILTAHRFNG